MQFVSCLFRVALLENRDEPGWVGVPVGGAATTTIDVDAFDGAAVAVPFTFVAVGRAPLLKVPFTTVPLPGEGVAVALAFVGVPLFTVEGVGAGVAMAGEPAEVGIAFEFVGKETGLSGEEGGLDWPSTRFAFGRLMGEAKDTATSATTIDNNTNVYDLMLNSVFIE
ncbi:9169_t:CDS:2 [Paraglomus occultum]|uniref:9169_t:CDS:1 n=1 Tax=Paraglomus occultum TaxID=144539 RepID=A0A9N8WB40_9GLOM|nr:9169_t:CDS:2 [Paraglomus occultum]